MASPDYHRWQLAGPHRLGKVQIKIYIHNIVVSANQRRDAVKADVLQPHCSKLQREAHTGSLLQTSSEPIDCWNKGQACRLC